ncbi:MAG: VWA domain-containing protein [Planctomycetota bacterium]|jgi:hypothetical protein
MCFYNPAMKKSSAMSNRFHAELQQLKLKTITMILVICGLALAFDWSVACAGTYEGELEERAAPVGRRKCVGGANADNLCKEDADCPGSTCTDRNVFNISVAVQFDADAAELTTIKDMISDGSAWLFDVTDGQAEIGEAFIYNNAYGTGSDADVRIYPDTTYTWWKATTGAWQLGGSIKVSIDNIPEVARPGESFAHEFFHLVFDARDEYESKEVGCGVWIADANCPDRVAILAGETPSLMGSKNYGPRSELCWGQGDPTNLTDISGGNHDATNVTEQSRCRDNRSCWAQLVWGWPSVFLAPAGAPDPAANGAVVNPTQFVMLDDTLRVVLVLDESGSMSLESPSRMERLMVAAKDFVALAEDGTELGIVSYSDDAETASGRVNVDIAALGADRSTWNDALDGMAPDAWTNIGDGLQKAMDMILAAPGGVTANTCIILMSDGINNQPSPQATADADLQGKLDDLLALGIPVYVTCTGGDLGVASQCSEIADGTDGFYVDSDDPARLPEAFTDLHERFSNRDAIGSYTSWIDTNDTGFYVEEGSESTTFTLIWQEQEADAYMAVIDPAGTVHESKPMPQGRFVRVKNPVEGNWEMVIDFKGPAPKHFVKRAYSRNRIHSLGAAVRHKNVLPGEDIYVYAYPRSIGGSVTDITKQISGTVLLPDGKMDIIKLNDMGYRLPEGGDDLHEDGIFTGVYKNTKMKGPYQFLLRSEIDGWGESTDTLKPNLNTKSPRFVREVRVSAAVGDPDDIVEDPEDGKPDTPSSRKWFASVHTGTSSPLGSFSNDYGPDHAFAVDLEYPLTQRLSLVGLLGYNAFNGTSAGVDDTYLINLSANLKYRHPLKNKWSAYIAGGPGYYFPEGGGSGMEHRSRIRL